LVRSRIIENWESTDEPEHLKTIRDRILRSKQRAGRLLGLYQQILLQGGVAADDSSEQMELRLTGLVVKREGKLRVYNRIYALAQANQTLTEANQTLTAAQRKANRRIQIGSIVLVISLIAATVAGVQARREQQRAAEANAQVQTAKVSLAETEVVLISTSSKALFLSELKFNALLEALRAGKR
jgi:hypothetical protein